MTNIDQFESAFKAADKPQFRYEAIPMRRVALIAAPARFESFRAHAAAYLRQLAPETGGTVSEIVCPPDLTTEAIVQQIANHEPELVCTYRHLHGGSDTHPYSLGTHLDVLTQETRYPVLVLPDPHGDWVPTTDPLGCVMAITDHLTGDHHLVSMAARMVRAGGCLWLTHVEDEATLERYLGTIAKLPQIDTDTARIALTRQLLKEPHDYIASCREGLQVARPDLQLAEEVALGHHLNDYKRLVSDHAVNLLVMNTKDDEQLAMHGMAYALAVELRQLPLLLL